MISKQAKLVILHILILVLFLANCGSYLLLQYGDIKLLYQFIGVSSILFNIASGWCLLILVVRLFLKIRDTQILGWCLGISIYSAIVTTFLLKLKVKLHFDFTLSFTLSIFIVLMTTIQYLLAKRNQ
jgi:hypothetical protein